MAISVVNCFQISIFAYHKQLNLSIILTFKALHE